MTNKSKTPDTCAFANQSFEHRDDELEKLYDFTEKLELERNKYRQALRGLSKLGLGAYGGGGGYDTYGKQREGKYYCDLNEAVKLETELIEAQKEIKELNKRNADLLTSLRKFSRYGLGPCGGGGAVDLYAQGQRATEGNIRSLARKELKKYGVQH